MAQKVIGLISLDSRRKSLLGTACRPQLGRTASLFQLSRTSTGAQSDRSIIPLYYGVRRPLFRSYQDAAATLLRRRENRKAPLCRKTKVATISKDDLKKIAELKAPDLNAASVEAAMRMIAGTARSMGVTVEE